MSATLHLTTFQIGTEPRTGEGLRIAVTRRPPRGVPKADWLRICRFDVWLPAVAPSAELLARFAPQQIDNPREWKRFLNAYQKELLASADTRQTVALLATLARHTPISIGCFCADESHCHRARLYEVIVAMASAED
ncbi:MAG: DUF488 family protein [Terracidiphilus sp.]